ncbi:hypothetical protein KPC83_05720 [Collinsella sp. zg1085]|uniref:hypothetical protein n=1 Tax=Collinsella sp. zg1085 TaxID=2844380 RepID=UPI001C0AFBF4|nr:hypothetical protein [Collinsella sp. zg1085]QWT17338.1 hypothetical protein KPC83_05720 [Collinsella sp. zg1085]
MKQTAQTRVAPITQLPRPKHAIIFPMLCTTLVSATLFLSGCGHTQPAGSNGSASSAQEAGSQTEQATKTDANNNTASATDEAANAAAQLAARIKEKEAAGMLVLKGTLHQYSRDELLKVQNGPQEVIDILEDSMYVVFVLDEPSELELRSGDGTGFSTQEVHMVHLRNYQGELPQTDKQLYLAINPNSTHFPSDVSLPLGEPRTNEYELLS